MDEISKQVKLLVGYNCIIFLLVNFKIGQINIISSFHNSRLDVSCTHSSKKCSSLITLSLRGAPSLCLEGLDSELQPHNHLLIVGVV